jgi:hypothetical protein
LKVPKTLFKTYLSMVRDRLHIMHRSMCSWRQANDEHIHALRDTRTARSALTRRTTKMRRTARSIRAIRQAEVAVFLVLREKKPGTTSSASPSVDWNSDAWVGWDEDVHGQIDGMEAFEDNPEGWKFTCCGEDGTADGCVTKRRTRSAWAGV